MLLLVGLTCLAQSNATPYKSARKDNVTMAHAMGTFDVKLLPLSSDQLPNGFGRMSIDKQFHGDIEGSSKGEMLSFGTGGKGSSGGYVALEQVTGTLNGRKGSFVLQHSATMNRGVPHMSITVVPDSGTDQLVGLTGTFNIIIADGKHSYDFEYSLPEAH
jgi:hypothetical protein